MLGGMHALLATVGLLASPAGGYHGTYVHGKPASFQAGAAIESFSPPLAGKAPGGDPANCSTNPVYNGPRKFAFEEPYTDTNHNGHYDPGEPFDDCNGDGRWDGNLLGGGGNTPRFYDHVADLVGARALVVGNGKQTIAVEVVDQEGLFDVYQARIRALVAKSGIHLNGIFISATHDESAPDTLGLGGVSETTSGVNNYFVNYLVQQSALAIEKAYRRMRPAHIRYTEVLEPSNVRQCWSSYPFVDDQHMPVLEAMGRNGKTIATLVSVSQHDETTGFNGGSALDPGTPFTLDQENSWISSDWIHFFRLRLTSRLGGVGIEMAGSVGSNESPEVYDGRNISRTPQQFIDASHPAGCRTLFDVGAGTDAAGILHVPLGYYGETRAFGQDMAKPVITALQSGDWHFSTSNQIWGARANVCVPLTNLLFLFGAKLGVFADRPGYNSGCTTRYPVAPNGSTNGTSLQSQVAAYQIGDGEFLSIPGEVFPFTYLGSFLGPQDMPHPAYGLPPWLIPHMHTPFRFIDGLAEDMVGYIFPAGNAVGIPSASNVNPSDTDRFGCGHSDDSESTGAQTGNIIGAALVKLLDAHGGPPEEIVKGRYILPGDKLSRDPLGGPEIKCNVDTVFHASGPATGWSCPPGRSSIPRSGCRSAGCHRPSPTATRGATLTPPASGCGWTCSRLPSSFPAGAILVRRLPKRGFWIPAAGGFFLLQIRTISPLHLYAQGHNSHPGRAHQPEGRARRADHPRPP